MNNHSSITLLRFLCCWEVFFLHWFARIGLRDYMWVWSGAVPCFLMVSAFIYGLRPKEKSVWGFRFIKKRWRAIAVTYYPFVIAVFIWYVINDFSNIGTYSLSLISELAFVTSITNPLPGCGHLWFMQTLALCYLLLAFLCSSDRWRAFFSRPRMVSLLVLLTFVVGGGKRDSTFVYLLFYWLTFVYANKILKYSKTISVWIQMTILVALYLIFLCHYEDVFWYGIYLRYFHTCIIAIFTISLFVRISEGKRLPKVVQWFSMLSMEIYLVHHLFVFNYPIYVSLPLTVILSIVLHWVGTRLKKYLFTHE